MRLLRLIGTTLLALGVCAGVVAPASATAGEVSPMIVGGQDATAAYSFMASVQTAAEGEHFCGGSLISASWVLTAAHCVKQDEPKDVRVRIGSLSTTKGGVLRNVSQIVNHPDYQPGDRNLHDLSLLKLDKPVSQQPVQLAAARPAESAAIRLIGWGCTTSGQSWCNPPAVLQQLDTAVRAPQGCVDAGGEMDPATQVCTGNPADNAGACKGDSGGPAVVRSGGSWRLFGAYSRIPDLFCYAGYGIYTDVPVHRDWIRQVSGV